MSVSIKVNHDSIGLRLDIFLHDHYYKNQSRSYVQHLIKEDNVLVNGEHVKTGYLLKLDDEISIEAIEIKPLNLEAVDLKLDIVYEDQDLLVINKPQGLVVHPASSYHEPTLVNGLLFQVDELSSINGVARPGIVHRIDKDTSGLLIVAKTDLAHQALSKDLSEHKIKREYIALVYGKFIENEGTIDAPIARNPKNRLKMSVISGGKSAKTHFKVVDRFNHYTLLICQLETGRTHQIRVHMAYIKHPVVGDALYGPKDVVGSTGQFLHAQKITFFHPTKKEYMTFTADIPKEFKKLLNKLIQDSAS